MPSALPALLTALLLAGATATSRLALEAEASRIGAVRNPAFLPDGRLLRLASFGQRLLLADLYWLKAVQYTGETLLAKSERWEALLPLAEIVTDLDPRYGWAYQVAGSNLGGLAHRPADAEQILLKGMRNLPERWSLPWTHAINKFLHEGDYKTAARYARQAAEVGRRPHLALLAANLSLVTDEAEEYDLTQGFLALAIEQAETADLRQQLERRLVRVRTFEALSRVEKALVAFEARFTRRPLSLDELVFHGLLPALPKDPSGGRFEYDAGSGQVRSSVTGQRRPIRAD